MGPRMVNLSECMDPKRFGFYLLNSHSFLYLGLGHSELKCEIGKNNAVKHPLDIVWTFLLEVRTFTEHIFQICLHTQELGVQCTACSRNLGNSGL